MILIIGFIFDGWYVLLLDVLELKLLIMCDLLNGIELWVTNWKERRLCRNLSKIIQSYYFYILCLIVHHIHRNPIVHAIVQSKIDVLN